MRRRIRAVARRAVHGVRARTYGPLVVELWSLASGVVLAAALAALVVVQPAVVLVGVPAAAGVGNWVWRRWLPPHARWRSHAARHRRRAELADAIDRAPHRGARGRRPEHNLYGVFVELRGTLVAVCFVYRAPDRPKDRPTIVETRQFAGTEVEAAAACVAAFEERAAAKERHAREQLDEGRDAAERDRLRRLRDAEDARLQAIDEAHRAELARREAELRHDDERAREREQRIEAEALARALKRR